MTGEISMFNLVFIIIPLSEAIVFGFVKELPNSDDGNNNNTTIKGAEMNAVTCETKAECLVNYTCGINQGILLNVSAVHEPQCIRGECTCRPYCLSKSQTFMDEIFYYCGPCGRVGSTCDSECSYETAVCGEDGFCRCFNGGKFYEASFCFLPFYGYEFALEMAIVTCIIIILGLLVASLYSALGTRRLRHLRSIRALLHEQNGTRESPPGDIPPKYDDVMQDLPSYQEAIRMTMGHEAIVEEGVINLAYQNDSGTRTNVNDAGSDLSVVRGESSLAEMKRTVQRAPPETADSQEENSEASDRYRGTPRHERLQSSMITNDQARRVASNHTQDQTFVTTAPQTNEIEPIDILARSTENEVGTSKFLPSPNVENQLKNSNQWIPNPNQTRAIPTPSSSSLKLPLDDPSTTPLPILSIMKSCTAENLGAVGERAEEATVTNNQSQRNRIDGLAGVRDKKGNTPSLTKSSYTPKPCTNSSAHNSCKTHEMNFMNTTNAEDGEENLAKSETVF